MRQDVVIRSACGRADEGKVVHHFADIGKQFRHFDSRLSILPELEWAFHQRPGVALPDAHTPLSLQWNAVVFGQIALGIECVHVTDTATHEKGDDGFHTRFVMGGSGGQGRLDS